MDTCGFSQVTSDVGRLVDERLGNPKTVKISKTLEQGYHRVTDINRVTVHTVGIVQPVHLRGILCRRHGGMEAAIRVWKRPER